MTAVAEKPTFLWLEITSQCQLECTHCYADSGPSGDHGTMTMDGWRRVINQAAVMGVRRVQFIGGEPTLHPGLVDLIDHALGCALAVEVFSNLVKVTDEQWRAFAQPGVSLACSYYSDDAKQTALITGRPSHDRTRANIAKATALGIPLRAGVIDMGNGQRTAEAHSDLVDLGVPTIGYDRLREVGRGVRDQGESARQLCGRCGDGKAAVMADGTVRPCIMARWMDVGDVRDTSLDMIVESLPAARESLISQGMAFVSGGACAPKGDDCWPHNRPLADSACPPSGDDCWPHNRAASACPPGGDDCWPHNRPIADSACPPSGDDCWPHNRPR